MDAEGYDVVVIGSGPGGYVCAIRCAQLGLKVACIEAYPTFGGTCLNVGCIPSKAILESSELFHKAETQFKRHGILVNPELDLAVLHARKDKIVGALTRGIAGLFKKHGIDGIQGKGVIRSPREVDVVTDQGSRTLSTRHVVIATGSKVRDLKGIERDDQRIFGSTQALSLPEVPEHLVVIGAGVIGLELGSVWRRLGAKVTVMEYLGTVFPMADPDVSKEALRAYKRQGIKFRFGVAVQSAVVEGDTVHVGFLDRDSGEASSLDCSHVLVAIGRRPYTDGLGCEAAGVELDPQGRVVVDGELRTSVPGIWGLGDVVQGPMLAHKAEEEGVAVAERIAGKPGHVNYDLVPSVIYTDPEVAWIGKSEPELEAEGVRYVVGRFPFMANGRAKALEATSGMVKLLVDAKTDRLLGAHMVGPMVGELIAEIGIAMEFGASAEDIARTCHAHPTLSEVVKEAALDAGGRVIHI